MATFPKRRRLTRAITILALAAACTYGLTHCAVLMPGDSFKGPLPIITNPQLSTADELRADVQALAGRIGERNVDHPDKLAAAEDFLAASLAKAGCKVTW